MSLKMNVRRSIALPHEPKPGRRLQAHRHGHDHSRGHDDGNHHHHIDHDGAHTHQHTHEVGTPNQGSCLVIRPASGLSGDMMLAGLARIASVGTEELQDIAISLGLPRDCVSLEPRAVNEIYGWGCKVVLPDETSHRTWSEIEKLIRASGISTKAKGLAERTFALLAMAEGKVHGIPAESVHFHEVGALDSILDIAISAELFVRLGPSQLICGPLPLCDGTVKCDHGLLPTPAPAVFELLQGVPVYGLPSQGETVTPTAIALLKGLGAQFGAWPRLTISNTALIYGGRILPGIANGALFAFGMVHKEGESGL